MVYTTRNDAIEQYIQPALGDFVSDFDVDAIFEEFFKYDREDGGFVPRGDVDFYEVARSNDVSGVAQAWVSPC